ncbi:MAG TPA: bifunctional aldolase/short-chain dehydrogenase [Acidobacteriota bacterium]|nr:bifunctional aldolase/short-chain dehydrogenase [Acidobacteriota bacterium]
MIQIASTYSAATGNHGSVENGSVSGDNSKLSNTRLHLMKNCWSDASVGEYIARYGPKWGEDLALRTYLSTIIGSQDRLVLHGGGNNSVKTFRTNILGQRVPVIFVKASGNNMAGIEPNGYTGLDLEYLKKLRSLPSLSDEDMVNEFCTHLFDSRAAVPSIETLVHAFIPKKFIDHTHADAILALTNQEGGEDLVREVLGPEILILEYVSPGFKLAQASAAAFEANPSSKAMIWMQHGLVSWGESARESYDTTIELNTRAEEYLAHRSRPTVDSNPTTTVSEAERRLPQVAPLVRGLLARSSGDMDRPWCRTILQPLITREVLEFTDSRLGKQIALTPPLTADFLIRTKALPLWIEEPSYSDLEKLRAQMKLAIQGFAADYDAYVERHQARMPKDVARLDSLPRIILMPGLGALCSGEDASVAGIVRDITAHTLAVKAQIAAMGGRYRGISEGQLFDMEYRSLQHAKFRNERPLPLGRETALITGAAGAIGSGIAHELLEQGCHVAVTDLPGPNLDALVEELRAGFRSRVVGIPLDVTDPESVSSGFDRVVQTWGGVDILVINQGVALVSGLAELDLESFRRLERINVEGTLLLFKQAARHFRHQGTGGDVILVSTKNVFAPGAKFGAYSATKSAAHQLARIASLELAEIDVRVNMVAPDAVFSHGDRKSGLWTEIGPERMRVRGLDQAGLEEYYRNRNLLKVKVTARHVAKAVIFFATRMTPTTGATIPVDGGLPDATPR